MFQEFFCCKWMRTNKMFFLEYTIYWCAYSFTISYLISICTISSSWIGWRVLQLARNYKGMYLFFFLFKNAMAIKLSLLKQIIWKKYTFFWMKQHRFTVIQTARTWRTVLVQRRWMCRRFVWQFFNSSRIKLLMKL